MIGLLPRAAALGIVSAALAACGGAPAASPATSETSAAPASPTAASVPASASAITAAEPTVFAPDVISTDDEEYRISFTPDGSTAFFARGTGFFPQSREATIMESHLVDGEWSEPTVATFSGTYPDIDPWVTPDGESIYFSSIRPVGDDDRRDAEVWRVDREGDGWGEPVHIAGIGSETDELGASVSADGQIWFASDRPGGAGGWDLYTASIDGDEASEPEAVEGLNTPAWEFNPAINADGDAVIFTSINRPGGSGLGDLFDATGDGDAWTEHGPLPINTPADEYHASLSPDGRTLYYVKRALDGDLYETEWQPTP